MGSPAHHRTGCVVHDGLLRGQRKEPAPLEGASVHGLLDSPGGPIIGRALCVLVRSDDWLKGCGANVGMKRMTGAFLRTSNRRGSPLISYLQTTRPLIATILPSQRSWPERWIASSLPAIVFDPSTSACLGP